MKVSFIILIFAAVSLLFSTVSAETVCYPAIPGDCNIRIEINIAFSYNESEISQNQIGSWVREIEETWNGPTGSQTYGDCGCEVKFQVNSIKVTDPNQINCNPGPPGYHCIMVTDYDKNPPQNQAGNETYRAYMFGVTQSGQSTNGWWSDIVSTPHPDSPTGENALDAAHEAGHMLGLGDDYDKGPPERYGRNIMGTTQGDDAKPTQDQIDTVVEKNCGQGACPDECCCGNGEVEDEKGEDCDPFALPTGCEEGKACCEICCTCHDDLHCDPQNGEFGTNEDCEEACESGQCLYNYDTGCWDCKEHDVVETPASADTVAPAGSGSDTGTGLSTIVGALGILAAAGMLVGGLKIGNNAFIVGGGIIAILATLMLIMQPIDIPPKLVEPPSPGNAGGPIGTLAPANFAMQSIEPEPADNPYEEVLKVRNETDFDETQGNMTEHVEKNVSDDENKAYCGDGVCQSGEDCGKCAQDCRCPENLECDPGDSDANSLGCAEVDEYCGDGNCGSGETCEDCLGDCPCGSGWECDPDDSGANSNGCVELEEESYCGDGFCDPEEDCVTCEGDCECECGDGYYMPEAGEDCECVDCEGACPEGTHCNPEASDTDELGCAPTYPEGAVCGNGRCEETEYCYTCWEDCRCTEYGMCCHPNHGGIGCGTEYCDPVDT
jgi:hypothetical protein